MALKEGDRPAQEDDRRRGTLVREDLGVGKPGAVVNRDVHVFPSNRAAPEALAVGEGGVVVLATVTHAPARAALDPPQLLDVEMDELAGTLALVAARRLEPEPAELAHPDPGQDPRDGRQRHPEQLGQLGPGEAQAPERGDRLDAVFWGAVGDAEGS